jgi:hypothetical protein
MLTQTVLTVTMGQRWLEWVALAAWVGLHPPDVLFLSILAKEIKALAYRS